MSDIPRTRRELRKGHYYHRGKDTQFMWSLPNLSSLASTVTSIICAFVFSQHNRRRRPHIVRNFLSDPDNDANSPETALWSSGCLEYTSSHQVIIFVRFPFFCVLFVLSTHQFPLFSSLPPPRWRRADGFERDITSTSHFRVVPWR